MSRPKSFQGQAMVAALVGLLVVLAAAPAHSCTLTCANGGELDTSACTCACPLPYTGTACSNYVCLLEEPSTSCSFCDVATFAYIAGGLLGAVLLLHLAGSVAMSTLNKGEGYLPYDPNRHKEAVDLKQLELEGEVVDHDQQITVSNRRRPMSDNVSVLKRKLKGTKLHQSLQEKIDSYRKVMSNTGIGATLSLALFFHLQYLAVMSNLNDLPDEISQVMRAFSWANLHVKVYSSVETTAVMRRLLSSEQSFWQEERNKEYLGHLTILGCMVMLIMVWYVINITTTWCLWFARRTNPMTGELFTNREVFTCIAGPFLGYPALLFRTLWVFFQGTVFSIMVGFTANDVLYLSLSGVLMVLYAVPYPALLGAVQVYGMTAREMSWKNTGLSWSIRTSRQYLREIFNPEHTYLRKKGLEGEEDGNITAVNDVKNKDSLPLEERNLNFTRTPSYVLERNVASTTMILPFVRGFQITQTLDSSGYWDGKQNFVRMWSWLFEMYKWYALPELVLDMVMRMWLALWLGTLREWAPLIMQISMVFVVVLIKFVWVMVMRPYPERSFNVFQAAYHLGLMVELFFLMMAKDSTNATYNTVVQGVIIMGILARVLPLAVSSWWCVVFVGLVLMKYAMDGPKYFRDFFHGTYMPWGACVGGGDGSDGEEGEDDESRKQIQVAKNVSTLAGLREKKGKKAVKMKGGNLSDAYSRTSSKDAEPLRIHIVFRCANREDTFNKEMQRRLIGEMRDKAAAPPNSLTIKEVEASPVIRYAGCYKGVVVVKTGKSNFLDDITTAWSLLEFMSKSGRLVEFEGVGTILDYAFMSDIGQYCLVLAFTIRRKRQLVMDMADAGVTQQEGEDQIRVALADAIDAAVGNLVLKDITYHGAHEITLKGFLQSVHTWHVSNLLDRGHMASELQTEGYELVRIDFLDAYEDRKLYKKLVEREKENAEYLMGKAFGRAEREFKRDRAEQAGSVAGGQQLTDVKVADVMDKDPASLLKSAKGGTDRDLIRMAEQQGRLKRMGSIVGLAEGQILEGNDGEVARGAEKEEESAVRSQEAVYEHEKRMRETQRLMRAAQMVEYEENAKRRADKYNVRRAALLS